MTVTVPSTKLTLDDILAIRHAYVFGEPVTRLAEQYGVHRNTIYKHVGYAHRGIKPKRAVKAPSPPLPEVAPDPGPEHDWRDRAACRDSETPEMFFPDRADHRTIAEAKRTCAQCAVSTACLAYAIETKSVGIFGGHELGKKIW